MITVPLWSGKERDGQDLREEFTSEEESLIENPSEDKGYVDASRDEDAKNEKFTVRLREDPNRKRFL